MLRFNFGWESAPDLAGSLQRSTDSLVEFTEGLLLREGRRINGRGEKGRKTKMSGREKKEGRDS